MHVVKLQTLLFPSRITSICFIQVGILAHFTKLDVSEAGVIISLSLLLSTPRYISLSSFFSM